MLLSVFTRHTTSCKFSKDRACKRCNCPKWVGGQVNGYYFRQSAKTRQWAEAEEVRVKLEEALIKGLPPFGTAVAASSAPPIPTPADPPPTSRTEVPEPRVPKPRPRVTVAQAVEAYLADAVSRSVETSTLKKLETIFRKQFLAWTRVEGIEYLDELELDTLLNFRNTWEDGPLAKQKKQSRVIGFFWACVRRRYLTETRIQAKLETQISSAVQAPVVAVVEYTYAVGDRIIVPAGARLYGQLQQADRSGLVSVKFDEIELLDGAREKIDAVGTGLDLGPIKGNVYGKNTGKNFLVRAASGLGSVLAEVAGNNSSAAFSEDDMLRERLAENIGTAGDSEVMNLDANSRVVVSVPADTKIYVVFTKHEQTPSELHKVAPTVQ